MARLGTAARLSRDHKADDTRTLGSRGDEPPRLPPRLPQGLAGTPSCPEPCHANDLIVFSDAAKDPLLYLDRARQAVADADTLVKAMDLGRAYDRLEALAFAAKDTRLEERLSNAGCGCACASAN